MKVLPESRLGKWSVALTGVFLFIITVFFLFRSLGLVTFDEGNWWNLTVGISVPIEITAFVLSVKAVRRNEKTLTTYISMSVGFLVILFLMTHSLFIND